MLFLTQIIGRAVDHSESAGGDRFGRIAEVVVSPNEPLPRVSAYQVRTGDGAVFIPAADLILSPSGKDATLARPFNDITPYRIPATDFSLGRDVLDKQIVDVHDYRVVRVNDILLEQTGPTGELRLYAVDAGVRGLLRRLGMENAAIRIGQMLGRGSDSAGSDKDPASVAGRVIRWEDVGSVPTHNAGEPLRLKVSHEKLKNLHPSEIGAILDDMDPADRNEVLESLDVETAAAALAEAEDSVQVAALQQMDEERAADILDEMPADEAADVLGDMDAAHREDLLGRMEAEEREEVEDLLPYGDRTAGGLMTTEYVVIPQTLTAQETIDTLRRLEPEAETIYYVYVTDEAERLTGVISLRDLIIAAPSRRVSDFMITTVRCVADDADVEEVAQTFDRYKLLALPVVDPDGRLKGIITIDDTLEQLLPADWRKRPTASR